MESEIQKLRKKIDKLDDELLQLLNLRMEYVKKIGEQKIKNNTSIYRPEREKEILTRLKKSRNRYLDDRAIDAIFLEIFAISRNLEKRERVAFLGPIGSYTHQAAEERFGAMSEYLPMHHISGVFSAIQSNRAKYGVIPIENSRNGIVGETIDCLVENDLKIISEIILPIHHCLATREENLSDIKMIYSKDIAFNQCDAFLHSYELENALRVPVDSAAKAASIVAKEKYSAAICSKISAKLYNLPTMFENIEDNGGNQTRFVIVSDFHNPPSNQDKTSAFAILREKPGVLLELLEDLKDHGINLSKIDSHPIKSGDHLDLGFYIDFFGHRNDENITKLFEKRGGELKWLGSYACDHG